MEQLNILPNVSLGFTGTRWGMGDLRVPIVSYLIEKLNPAVAHHGLCKGSDTEFHHLVRKVTNARIVGHPPIRKGTYVYSECDEYWEDKEYIDRDKDIVDESDILIATPNTVQEVLRSGTWTTVRYARKRMKVASAKCKKIYIVTPDGKVATETA